jgi:hypothetical protein
MVPGGEIFNLGRVAAADMGRDIWPVQEKSGRSRLVPHFF